MNLSAVHAKLNGIELRESLAQQTAQPMAEIRPSWVDKECLGGGVSNQDIDGLCLAATDHRLKVLR